MADKTNAVETNSASAAQELDEASFNEVSTMIQTVLNQTQDRFQTMSNTVMQRIDAMSDRIGDMEKKLEELMQQAGMEADTSGGTHSTTANS